MIQAIQLEFFKIRRRKVSWIIAALLGVQCLWSLWAILRMDSSDLKQGWLYLLYQFPLLNAIVLPTTIAVLASRLSDVEHKGQTLRLLEVVMPAGRLFDAKFLCGAVYMVAVVLFQAAVMLASGTLCGFSDGAPFAKIGLYLLFTTGVNLTILTLQQTLSLQFVNQMVAFTVGIMGSFFGLFSMFFPQSIQKLIVWGYYGVLMTVGLNWDLGTRIMDFYWAQIDWWGWVLLIVQFCVFYSVGRAAFIRKEN
jgi:lantibiotic transport system permease protein